MRNRMITGLLCSLLLIPGVSLSARADALALLVDQQIAAVKQQLAQHHAPEQTTAAWQALQRQADAALQHPLMSVTDKSMTPASGSKHDYLSLSAYWWPDDSKTDGLPWVRRDGEVNPASKNQQSDGLRLAAFTADVQALTLAWYFSADQRYADKAIAQLRSWFIAPQTRMNPNLNFAQGVPGVAAGRASGVLDGRYFATRIVDSLIILRQAPGWKASDQQAMQQWMSDYLHWLQTSKLAKKEAQAKNNHGNWYAVQVAGIAWYLQQPALIKQMVALAESKLRYQIAADGSQPQELARTRSFHYSYFNLQALTALAELAEKADAGDLWHYQNAQQAGILRALDFMAPYTSDARPWPYKSLDRVSERLIPLLSLADNRLHDTRYQRQIQQADFSRGEQAEGDPQEVGRGAVIQAQRETWLLSQPHWQQQENHG
ncbi:alginate lyase family protein [Pantoea sp. B65]|uniref:alginate lyase family protein n=1 Tax=Pantoea sp. B65 TaxID=2813359 RepID=UPI0039B56ECF